MADRDTREGAWLVWIDVDGTLVGGHPGLRVYVRLPRWVGFWKARRDGVIV